MTKKVYCKNCRWDFIKKISNICPAELKDKKTVRNKYCKYYEKKWWRRLLGLK